LRFPEKALLNAFRPGEALDDPYLFAGRRDQVIELAQNLHVPGVCPIIYGARGLGKSSLALQAQLIAMGDVTLLESYGEHQWAFGQDDAYLAFYVPCSASMRDTSSILQRIINSFSSIGVDDPQEPNQLVDRTTTRRITLKIFQTETLKKYQLPDKTPTYHDLAIDEKLLNAAWRLSEAHGQRILVIIDELDLVRDTSGLASFIKNASSSGLKFILVGIAQNVSTLLDDHQSLERIVVPIRVPRMTEAESSQIIHRAMRSLAEQGIHLGRFRFDEDATQTLAKLARGFPWFVHVLGQSALLAAYRASDSVVRIHDVASAVVSLSDNRFAQQFRDRYQMIVGDSWRREMVLRTLALWPSQDIPTKEIYRVLRRLKVTNPSSYVSRLISDSYGPILLRPPFQERGNLRFANEMFKVYIRLRKPLFDVERHIQEAWQAEFQGTEFAHDAEPIVPA
jgi:Cdc6-like AAA superfamily ATPase